jgi:hypothetical protein
VFNVCGFVLDLIVVEIHSNYGGNTQIIDYVKEGSEVSMSVRCFPYSKPSLIWLVSL